jgi:hypothetical protein
MRDSNEGRRGADWQIQSVAATKTKARCLGSCLADVGASPLLLGIRERVELRCSYEELVASRLPIARAAASQWISRLLGAHPYGRALVVRALKVRLAAIGRLTIAILTDKAKSRVFRANKSRLP